MTTVLYPGSFDPIHLGHLDVIEQSAELFTSPDKGVVVVAVMHNHDKPGGVFTVYERVRLITESAAAPGPPLGQSPPLSRIRAGSRDDARRCRATLQGLLGDAQRRSVYFE